jgi:hypothetical protein
MAAGGSPWWAAGRQPTLGCYTPRVLGGLGRGSAESRSMVTWTGNGRPGLPRSKSYNGNRDQPLATAQLQKPVAFSHVTRAALPAAQHCSSDTTVIGGGPQAGPQENPRPSHHGRLTGTYNLLHERQAAYLLFLGIDFAQWILIQRE